jgi:phosphonate transport system substrate-binding protein
VSTTSPPSAPQAPRPRRLFTPLTVVSALFVLVLVGIALALLQPDRVSSWLPWRPKPDHDRELRGLREGMRLSARLDDRYQDADGDLVADPPGDAGRFADPETLVFATLGPDYEREKEIWKEFIEHLERTTHKKVKLVEPPESGFETARRMRDGEIHLACVSTGAVPVAVNTGGFVPFCVMGNDAGAFGYHVEVLVPAGGPARSLADLKGKTVTVTTWSSFSSARAPLALLYKEAGCLPYRDYQIRHASNTEALVKGVASGQYDAVAVPTDLLRRLEADGKAEPAKYRSVYRSPETYPPACFGHVHTLDPKTAKAVEEAFLSFSWADTNLARAYHPADQTRFVKASYKKDWESVRQVDAALAEMLGR